MTDRDILINNKYNFIFHVLKLLELKILSPHEILGDELDNISPVVVTLNTRQG